MKTMDGLSPPLHIKPTGANGHHREPAQTTPSPRPDWGFTGVKGPYHGVKGALNKVRLERAT